MRAQRGRRSPVLGSLAMAAALLLLTAIAPLPVAAASYGSCVDAFEGHFFAYTEKAPASQNVRNVRADITTKSVTDQFRPCKWDAGLDGSGAWVAIEPSAGNPKNGDPESILQIGVIACNEDTQSACTVVPSGWKTYFWAEGGCGASLPDAQYLGGPVDNSSHTYEIRHLSGNVYRLRIDGVTKVSFVASTHSDVSCWIQSNYDKGQWAYERHDRGDGLGDSTHKADIGFSHLMYGDPGDGGTWADPNFTFCQAQPTSGTGRSFCSFGVNYIFGWTQY
jgi:hypothetical protein